MISLADILNNPEKTNDKPSITIPVLKVIHHGPIIDLLYLIFISRYDWDNQKIKLYLNCAKNISKRN